MRFVHDDGSVQEFDSPEDYRLFLKAYQELFGNPPAVPNKADLVAAKMDELRASEPVVSEPIPVTQNEMDAIKILKEYGADGASTKDVAVLLDWTHAKASRVVTTMERQGRAVERVDGHKRYRVKDPDATYWVVANPTSVLRPRGSRKRSAAAG